MIDRTKHLHDQAMKLCDVADEHRKRSSLSNARAKDCLMNAYALERHAAISQMLDSSEKTSYRMLLTSAGHIAANIGLPADVGVPLAMALSLSPSDEQTLCSEECLRHCDHVLDNQEKVTK